MLTRSFRPASCRNTRPFRAYSLTFLWLAAIVLAPAFPVRAHEGHVHEASATVTATGLPRLVTKSESYELVAILDGKQLTIYLDRFADNAPVTDANIGVAVEGETVAAERNPDGTYGLTSNLFGGQGSIELVFDIKAPEVDDLLIGKLWLGGGPDDTSNPTSWFGRASSAVRHGARDHLFLLGLAVFCGAAAGFAVRRRRSVPVSSMMMLTVASLAIASSDSSAQAHEGHDHGDEAKTLIAPSDNARRLPGGQVF